MPRRIWGLMVILLVLVMGVAGVYFFMGGKGSETGWRTFRNAQSGYEIRLPSDWTNETVPGAAEVFWSPDRRAYVAVQFIDDPRLLEEGGEEKMIREIRESFKEDPGYELFSFRSRFEEEMPEPATVSGYLAQGKLSFQNQGYVFQEYAVQVANEEILAVIRGAMREEVVGEYENTVEEIMGSFNPVAGRREAIALVKNQSEVVGFEKQLARLGKKATYGSVDDGDDWLVQVYEVVENGPAEIRGISASLRGPTHTATFNWYRVNKETKKITKEFEINE